MSESEPIKNIANSWLETAGDFYMQSNGYMLKRLEKLTRQEIGTLLAILNEKLLSMGADNV